MSKTTVVCVCTALVLALTCAGAGATTYYVEIDAAGGDGLTWGNAFGDLQDALDVATSGDEIWVAEGVYIPSDKTDAGNDRSATFGLLDGVEIYGGFPDGGGTMTDRNIELYETILSGDLGSDDSPSVPFQGYIENAYHVVDGSGSDTGARLDGFTIIGGSANVPNDHETAWGGGIYFFAGDGVGPNSGEATIINCTFKLNQAVAGGGALIYRGTPLFEHCTFWRNRAITSTYATGGGLYNTSGVGENVGFGDMTIKDCRFIENTSARYAGGSCSGNNVPLYVNCDFVGNTVTGTLGQTGAALSIGCGSSTGNCSGTPKVVNCTFVRNKMLDGDGAGGFYFEKDTVIEIHNSIFWENEDVDGINEDAQIEAPDDALVKVTHTNIDGLDPSGWYATGDDVGNIDVEPDFLQMAYSPDDPGGNALNVLVGNTHVLTGSPTNDVGNNSEIPSGVTLDRDGIDRTLDDGGGADVDLGPYEFGYPYLLADGVAGTSFSFHAFNRYIDPRSETSDGSTLDRGISQVTLVFSEQVRDVGASGTAETLSPSSFYVMETGGASPPTVECVCYRYGHRITLTAPKGIEAASMDASALSPKRRLK